MESQVGGGMKGDEQKRRKRDEGRKMGIRRNNTGKEH